MLLLILLTRDADVDCGRVEVQKLSASLATSSSLLTQSLKVQQQQQLELAQLKRRKLTVEVLKADAACNTLTSKADAACNTEFLATEEQLPKGMT
jgi:hypothetical protein